MPLKKTECEQALNKDVADALANGMGSDISSGTAASAASSVGWSGMSAKTGTTETSYSAAFLGFTPKWAGSTYIFNDGGTSMNLCTAPVRQCAEGNLYGGNEPAQTFLETSKTGSVAMAPDYRATTENTILVQAQENSPPKTEPKHSDQFKFNRTFEGSFFPLA